ncbi:MAG: CDP-glucose 4,6-dehydratase [Candidatus Devosia phytovorans]|uniref:CDP-glucose 4,6-dehydratase n=1 Tax=Candidatus Devosia phytovorans TaxID=3121372 RepID=A0AAJ5VTB3_9HYPH|nr:CDP-glucose 4,6-dehydratase [Devosia sp.]WEK03781.1 MAG: CDP-glucose 4,6-dehydratase [Devosia sp.]
MNNSGDSFAALAGKRVFLTGHTGFKGAWLTMLLHRLGCEVHGYALPPESDPNLFSLASVQDYLAGETIADIRDRRALTHAMQAARPDLVLHLAAQAFVRRSYAEPADTWDINVTGTSNVLDAARSTSDLSAIVVVTTDKCYENKNWDWGYRETDTLGGHDPYSASKAAAELTVQSYRRSFFSAGKTLLASARAGNVIGGGDWSEDRLIADAARAVAARNPLLIRNPTATRPWQHVLDCLGGYLTLSCALLEGNSAAATAFNFGPLESGNLSVQNVLGKLQMNWPGLIWSTMQTDGARHEAQLLYLDSAKARNQLGWRPRWTVDTALEKTAGWYREIAANPTHAMAATRQQIEDFLS